MESGIHAPEPVGARIGWFGAVRYGSDKFRTTVREPSSALIPGLNENIRTNRGVDFIAYEYRARYRPGFGLQYCSKSE